MQKRESNIIAQTVVTRSSIVKRGSLRQQLTEGALRARPKLKCFFRLSRNEQRNFPLQGVLDDAYPKGVGLIGTILADVATGAGPPRGTHEAKLTSLQMVALNIAGIVSTRNTTEWPHRSVRRLLLH